MATTLDDLQQRALDPLSVSLFTCLSDEHKWLHLQSCSVQEFQKRQRRGKWWVYSSNIGVIKIQFSMTGGSESKASLFASITKDVKKILLCDARKDLKSLLLCRVI